MSRQDAGVVSRDYLLRLSDDADFSIVGISGINRFIVEQQYALEFVQLHPFYAAIRLGISLRLYLARFVELGSCCSPRIPSGPSSN
jgi:hypothetical protein